MADKKLEAEGIFILRLKGNLKDYKVTEKITKIVENCLGLGYKKFIFNLEKIQWIEAVGLGFLIGRLTDIKKAGGELKLTTLSEQVQSKCVITKLVTIFDFCDSEDEAIRLFNTLKSEKSQPKKAIPKKPKKK